MKSDGRESDRYVSDQLSSYSRTKRRRRRTGHAPCRRPASYVGNINSIDKTLSLLALIFVLGTSIVMIECFQRNSNQCDLISRASRSLPPARPQRQRQRARLRQHNFSSSNPKSCLPTPSWTRLNDDTGDLMVLNASTRPNVSAKTTINKPTQKKQAKRRRKQQQQEQQDSESLSGVKSSFPRSPNEQQASATTSKNSSPPLILIEKILSDLSYGSRIVRLSSSSLPKFAEVQLQGTMQICRITKILFPNKSGSDSSMTTNQQQPKFEIQLVPVDINNVDGCGSSLSPSSAITVDVGQITTIWDDVEQPNDENISVNPSLLDTGSDDDLLLESLYRSKVGRARGSTKDSLTKKDIPILAAKCAIAAEDNENIDDNSDWNTNVFYEQILRQVMKAGIGYARLVDSSMMIKDNAEPSSFSSTIQQRFEAAQALARDSNLGGRFKRYPCMWLGSDSSICTHDHTTGDITISVLNGGWLVQDQSVRASSEGRKFASLVKKKNNHSLEDDSEMMLLSPPIEDRIAHRLECLAMGGQVLDEDRNDEETNRDENGLSLDVRTALEALQLPLTSQGAKEALFRLGRWSEVDGGSSNQGYEPWATNVLESARWYRHADHLRKERLRGSLRERDTKKDLEGRIDLSNLPAICVDAAKATFRDDAIAIRPRASTGRKVDLDASKWEILIHIADVSDIYAPEIRLLVDDRDSHDDKQQHHLRTLAESAAQRGTSRYDLPLGPLHLMPHTALEALALDTYKPDLSSSKQRPTTRNRNDAVNRCVSIWVYIDERNGKVVDAGIERTIVSRPLALSFATATDFLEQDYITAQTQEDPMLTKARAILKVVYRNVNLWSTYYRSQSEGAAAREDRLAARETIGRYTRSNFDQTSRSDDRHRRVVRDDGHDGFQRSRGHRLIDATMDLYSYALKGLMRRSGGSAPLPRVAGTEQGRVATGPLRRYIDGMAQRQALSVLCEYGGPPLTLEECKEIGRRATNALNQVTNLNESKVKGAPEGPKANKRIQSNQLKAIHRLDKVARQQRQQDQDRVLFKAIYTGKSSEVVLVDVFGAVATCRGIQGTLKPGTNIIVYLQSVDNKTGKIIVRYLRN